MIDHFTYPQGDIQTWDITLGEQVSADIPDQIREIMEVGRDALHLAIWRPTETQLMQERAMMIGELISVDEEMLDVRNRTVLRVRDRISGLSFRPTNPLTLNVESLPEEDAELLNAAYARMHLHPREKKLRKHLFDGEEGMREWLSLPIRTYEAESPAEIEKILSEISTFISQHRRVKGWKRGRRRKKGTLVLRQVIKLL